MTYCENCRHLFNRCYDDDLVDYEADYDNSQMFSSRFRRYAEELSDRLITTYNLYQRNVVEIGGGRGEFLRIKRGQKVVAWGAGAKATTFLNIVDPAGSVVSHVVDINPRKTGRFRTTDHRAECPQRIVSRPYSDE